MSLERAGCQFYEEIIKGLVRLMPIASAGSTTFCRSERNCVSAEFRVRQNVFEDKFVQPGLLWVLSQGF